MKYNGRNNIKYLSKLLPLAFALLLILLFTCGCSSDSGKAKAGPVIPSLPERILFVGDSRTVDMFTDSETEIPGGNRDGITVFALDASNHMFLKEVLDLYKNRNYDMLISWMGANDRGDFSGYEDLYESVLSSGKLLVLCTVGPTDEASLLEIDKTNYTNRQMQQFNTDLSAWAAAHEVPVIDLWSYISDPANGVSVDPADGVHYLPRPTAQIWQYILNQLGYEGR